MQRILDLIYIGSGAIKVSQASVQSTCKHVEYWIKTSSVAASVIDKIKEVKNENYSEVNTKVNENIDGKSRKISNKPLANKKSTPNNTTISTHSFSSYAKLSTFKKVQKRNKIHAFNSFSNFHTSSSVFALTSEDLAKLAKLKKVRKSQVKTNNSEKLLAPTLNPESKEKKVPSSRIGRISSFGGLAAGLALGTLSDYAKKTVGFSVEESSKSVNSSLLLSESNLNRIVTTLCTVRGAALKLGQMLSIQDSSVVDPKLLEVFDRVRQSADFMPASQMKKVLVQEFGENWRSKVKEFDEKPFAAASIGQVHRAILHNDRVVAVKIQYPGVADSIDSDVNNLVTLLKFWNVFPEQMFVDKFIDVARVELALECDYEREAEFSEEFRKKLAGEEIYGVPEVIRELSGKRVLTTELVSGVPIDKVAALDQDDKNFVAAAVLRLVLRELFEFRCMQTDPNWSNFLYDQDQQKLWLLDFGAARHYPKPFVDQYIEIVKGASVGDRQKVLEISKKLGFLTGYEPKIMEEAHIDAIMILGEPFSSDTVFDFSKQSTSNRIMKLVPTFLKHRLTPPPEESYSLHRKLSGAFLIAAKLQAQFACKEMFDDAYDNYPRDDSDYSTTN